MSKQGPPFCNLLQLDSSSFAIGLLHKERSSWPAFLPEYSGTALQAQRTTIRPDHAGAFYQACLPGAADSRASPNVARAEDPEGSGEPEG